MSALTIPEVLNRAADLIEPEGRWTQGAFARAADGGAIASSSPIAKCFCMAGAIYAVSPNRDFGSKVIDRLVKPRGYDHIAQWNDEPTRKQTQVVARLRKEALRSAALLAAPRAGEG